MIKKRVHSLKYFEVIPGEAYQDEFDNWHPGVDTQKEVILDCRADINNGHTIQNNQGQAFVYSFAIFLDRIPESLKRGTKVEILKDGEVVGKGEVILPWGFQATNKLWV
ncbi:hypothetical protein [Sphingobacterium thalpophilum]|uniref:hypothetical protein n=1 Tax=Sphingobacterium thalpophilum TaxID=259 RepID=UPI003D998BA0